jgi:hypothetical protein
VRAAAIVGLLVVVIGSSGCTLGANEELKRVVEQSLIPGMYLADCEWGSSSYELEPKSWYGCRGYLTGDLAGAESTLQTRLAARGFDVTTRRHGSSVELTALRQAATVCVDVLAPGFADGRNTSPEEIDPEPDEVFVDVWSAEPRTATSDVCIELPAWTEE